MFTAGSVRYSSVEQQTNDNCLASARQVSSVEQQTNVYCWISQVSSVEQQTNNNCLASVRIVLLNSRPMFTAGSVRLVLLNSRPMFTAGSDRIVLLNSRPMFTAGSVRMFGVSAGLRIKDVHVAIPENFRKLKQKQKAFSLDDGLRVHEKGGATDKILYNISGLIVLIGFVEWCRVVWTLAYPDWKTFLTKN
ncbi:uncharacterized protein LOC111700302 [Eurytemora carolleeae]|uniref:uncharacterized protein LOC111700302 n=1 Tax=Eurytemora carolleeae TaxID=1294199 RepID=UPI000C792941|nr:uncharacterized protein LOC111700302 [Eurytemora carolleeae]|eukprot:XP_023326942.1 uncharacterized protein LOC111700302 [Eurytemora affinis]